MSDKWETFEQNRGQSSSTPTSASGAVSPTATKLSSQAIPAVDETLRGVDELKHTITRIRETKATIKQNAPVSGSVVFSGATGEDPLSEALDKLDGTINTGREVLISLGVAPQIGLSASEPAPAASFGFGSSSNYDKE